MRLTFHQAGSPPPADAADTVAPPPGPPSLFDVETVAEMLSCSARHVYRLADAGRMPPPVRLGALVRWRRADLEAWLVAGCPAMRKGGRS